MTPENYNAQFDDIYFSKADGLAETNYVFLTGNNLPQRLPERKRFTICETGFGTGLNFLCAWKLFEESAPADAVLDYVSLEKYPLSGAEAFSLLQHWAGHFEGRLERLIKSWPLRIPGFHRIHITPRVRLTLILDDALAGLSALEAPRGVDAWFLDGYAPAKNPEMWNEALYAQMARLSAPGATLATFTAAGTVRRGLQAAGFEITRVKGFGYKDHMTTGVFAGADINAGEAAAPRRIAIIGGGLAGASCAYALSHRGFHTVIFERDEIASGASGNPVGLVNPRFTAQRSAESDFYAAGFALAGRTFSGFGDAVDFTPCGALHLLNDPEKEKRLRATAQNWGWHEDHMRIVADASTSAGVALGTDCLHLPDAFALNPRKLCEAYTCDIDVQKGAVNIERAQNSWRINGQDFDTLIIAAGPDSAKILPALDWLPIDSVRGQITCLAPGGAASAVRTNLCYGGYLSVPVGGVQAVGSTFQKWLTDTHVRAEDDADNLAKLHEAVPALEMPVAASSRAALRTASRDRFPLAGSVPDEALWMGGGQGNIPGLYISTAHGSHGILSSLMAAEMLADRLDESPVCLPAPSLSALKPARFIERTLRKTRA